MNFLFWNVNGNGVAQLIGKAALDYDLDLIVLAESEMPWELLAESLNSGQGAATYRPFPSLGGKGNELTLISRLPEEWVIPVADFPGLSFRTITPLEGPSFTVGMAHLRSKLHQKETSQIVASTVVAGYVKEAEALAGHRQTLLVGDLNMNPFEVGVVSAAGLHAVGVRSVAARSERSVANVQYPFFYNPMWAHFGDRISGPPGTYFYRGSDYVEYFWQTFDQVLVRPDLLDYFDDSSLRILTSIDNTNLLTPSGTPDPEVASDHLPLVFSLRAQRP